MAYEVGHSAPRIALQQNPHCGSPLTEVRDFMSRSMSLQGRILVVASAVIALVPFAPLPAQSHQFSAGSNISISRDGNTYRGRVSSSRNSCEGNRSVTLFRTRHGDTSVAERTTTNSNGNWSATARRKGRFHATVSSRTRGQYPHAHTCRGDRSRTIIRN